MDDEGKANVETEVSVTMKEEITLEGGKEREYPGWRIPLSIVTGIGWLVFLVIWLFFYAGDYKLVQNIGVFLLSIMVVALILGLAWALWAFSGMTEFEQMMMQMGGMKNRMIFSMIIPIVCLIFLGIWLFLWAVDYDVYQNIAVVIVDILVMGGLLGLLWTTGGWKIGGRS